MASDYEAITQDNIKRRGTDFTDTGRFISEQLYSDRTHFIYELIQNAEDALGRRYKASPESLLPNKIEFKLFIDKLEVRHYGQLFDVNDVKAISDVLKGTKANDFQQIGRFGIGFKSVYAFTSTPEIHSGDEHFRLKEYIQVERVEEQELAPGETLFVFPFNHYSETKEKTYQRIKDKLKELDEKSIVFLQYIDQITFSIEGENVDFLKKNISSITQSCQKITISKRRSQSSWLVFSKASDTNIHRRVDVAFKLRRDDLTSKEKIDSTIQSSPVIVFLPTELETNLRFLINGPYLTTPARDNILNEGNEDLISLTANLVAEIPVMLCTDKALLELDLLNIDFYNVLPVRLGDLNDKHRFFQIPNAVKESFLNNSILPSSTEGHYISAKEARLAGSSDLRKLLSESQLSMLVDEPASWVSEEITEKSRQTSDLYRYLKDILGIDEIDPEAFVRKISINFLEKQDDIWMSRLYAFFDGQKALVRNNFLSKKAIIRLEDNRHVLPFSGDNYPNAYLPVIEDNSLSFPTVKRAILRNSLTKNDAISFLRSLGIIEPDWVAIVTQGILPKYRSPNPQVNSDEHKEDLGKILKAFDEVSKISPNGFGSNSLRNQKRQEQFIDELKKTSFLIASNSARPTQRKFLPPARIYSRDPNLEIYFKENPNIWFLDESDEYAKLLEKLGIQKDVKITLRKTSSEGYVLFKEERGNYQRGVAGFDKNFIIDGLEFALKNPSIVKSAYIWNYLLRNKRHIACIQGTIEKSSTKTFRKTEPPIKSESISGRQLTSNCWLPNKSGDFFLPNKLSLDDLPSDFITDDDLARQLANKLGMMPSLNVTEVMQKLPKKYREKVKPEHLDYIYKHPEEIEKLIQQDLAKGLADKDSDIKDDQDNSVDSINYKAAFQNTFSKPGLNPSFPSPSPSTPVSDPEARAKKIEGEIKSEKSDESNLIRFKQVTSKIWDKKDNAIRQFLLEEYSGKCQVCKYTFQKRDGSFYFEGVYIVSYTKASWIDRAGNVLCLCANCCAKFKHGSVKIEGNIFDEIDRFVPHAKGGSQSHEIPLRLCGDLVSLTFTERHIIETQALLKASD